MKNNGKSTGRQAAGSKANVRPPSAQGQKQPGRALPRPPAPPVATPRAKALQRPPSPADELLAIVHAVVAVLAAWRTRARSEAALALVAALDAVVGRAALFAGVDPGAGRLVAMKTGPVVGLRVGPVDPAEETAPFPAEHDPVLATLAADIAVVLDAHDELSPRSRQAAHLHVALLNALGLARSWLEAPEGKRLLAPEREAALYLVDVGPNGAPKPAPPYIAPALRGLHLALATAVGEAIGNHGEALEANLAMEDTSGILATHGAPTNDLDEWLEEQRRSLRMLGIHLASLSTFLTGKDSNVPMTAHAVALERLTHLLSPEHHQRLVNEQTREQALLAWAGPND